MRQISSSVGLRGVNRKDDVRAVQELLNLVPHGDGGPLQKLKEDGLCGRKTNGAIEKLQATEWGWQRVSTRVEPGSSTWKLLSSYDVPAKAAAAAAPPPPPPEPPKLVSSNFLILMAARPGQRINANGENFYFLITDKMNQSMRSLYYFGNLNAPPPPPQPLTWSITIPTIVTTPQPLGAADWAGDAVFSESEDNTGVRTRMYFAPIALPRVIPVELHAHLNEASGGGGWRTSFSAPFRLVDADTVYHWQQEGKVSL